MAATNLPALLTIIREVQRRHMDVPREVVAAAQPYVTLAGPGLSINFQYSPMHIPFQQLPFRHSAVPSLYFHALLDSLAEFAETPRLQSSAGHDIRLKTAPLPHFWDAVGNLNTTYTTVYTEGDADVSRHPAMGAVELAQSTTRDAKDVRLSLFDSAYRPMATMVLTGPHSTRNNDVGAARRDDGVRKMLPESMQRLDLHGSACDGQSAAHSSSSWCMIGDIVLLPGGSLAHRAMFHQTVSPTDEKMDDEAPPWLLHAAMAEFCGKLGRCGHLGPSPPPRVKEEQGHQGAAEEEAWGLVAHNALSSGDVVCGVPFDLVCAPPKVFERYRLPPWRQRVGVPALRRAESRCVALNVEVRQSGRVALGGVFYFSPLSAS